MRAGDAEARRYLVELVRRESAVVLNAAALHGAEQRLGQIFTASGVGCLSELVDTLRRDPQPRLIQAVVEALMTHETSFFRDVHPFQVLAEEVLPGLIAARSAERSLNQWSAACSTGQEPYSMAMLIQDRVPALSGWDVRIVGLDIGRPALERAMSGLYNDAEIGRGLDPDQRCRFFDREDRRWRVVPSLRRRVEFAQVNLAERWPRLPRPDVVFLRNVLIYFDAPTREGIREQLKGVMRTGGCVFTDASDTVFALDPTFERRRSGRTTYYQRR